MADNNTPVVTGTEKPEAQTAQQGSAAPAPAAPAATENKLSAFDDDAWSNEPVVEEPAKQEPPKTADPAKPAPAASTTKEEGGDEVVDANEYLKRELEYDSWDAAKKDLAELRQLRTTAPKAQKFEEVVKEKEEDIYNYLRAKRELANVTTLDAAKPEDAARIIKMNLQYENKDLTQDEINYLFNKQYSLPKKPVQKEDQDDDDYQEQVRSWEEVTTDRKMAISIAAKMAKPKLTQYATTLAIPEINIGTPAPAAPSPQDVAAVEQMQKDYFQAVSKGVKEFKSFDVEYKEDNISIPIKYEVSDQDRAKVEPILKSLATDISYFEKRWGNPDGSMNAAKMAEDIFLLENRGNVFQKIANEAATQRLALDVQSRSNIQLDGGNGGNIPNRTTTDVPFAEEVWNN